MSATVFAQSLDGTWQRMGADRVRGVWPEGLRATANDWGPDTCSFVLRRDPGAVFPDVLPFTPIDAEVAGELDFGGYIWEPPQQADERAIAVECRGWQYHTDDDLIDRLYVHSRLESWIDTRSIFGVSLVDFPETPGVTAGDGVLVLGWADTDTATISTQAGVTLDLGPGVTAKRVAITYDFTVGMTAGWSLRVTGHDAPNYSSPAGETPIDFAGSSSGSGTVAGTFTTTRRYVSIRLVRTGATGVLVGDALARITSAIVFGQAYYDRGAAYQTSTASILKASDVVADLLPFCPLLDQRTHLIQASTVSIPHFVLEENTPRQGMEQANVVEGYQLRVTPERLLEYRPRPTVPILKAGKWSGEGAGLSGASRGSGEPINNRVVVKGNDSSGGRVVVERYAGQQPGVPAEVVASPAFANPSFAVDATGWAITFGAGVLTRDAATFDTSPAAGRISTIADVTATLTGTFKKGVTYVVRGRVRVGTTVPAAPGSLRLALGVTDEFVRVDLATVANSFVDAEIVWTPRADRTGVTLTVAWGADANPWWVDSWTIAVTRPTLPDRRGFVRTRAIRVERPLTAADGQTMADAALKDAMRTPLKGDQTVYRGDVRTFLGDQAVHPGHLLRHAGELVHQSHLIDPDTGNLGRDSRIVAVGYEDDAGAATVSLDNTRTDFGTQLARYEVTGR